MRLRRHSRQPVQRGRVARVQDTALFRGALLEIQRLDGENHRLRERLAQLDPAHAEQTLDQRGEWVRDGRPET